MFQSDPELFHPGKKQGPCSVNIIEFLLQNSVSAANALFQKHLFSLNARATLLYVHQHLSNSANIRQN